MAENNDSTERNYEGKAVNLCREDRLLIHCARLNLSLNQCETIKDFLAEGIDWDLLINKATWQRLSPVLAHWLMSPELCDFIPDAILQRMKGIYYQNLARNIALQNELTRLVFIFQQEEIPVILLKGAALLESIYRDIGLRPMGDLDILVRPENLDKAEAIAFEQGYSFLADRELQEQTRKNGHHLANLWNQEKRIILEIHHHIVSPDEPYYFNLDNFWARARPVTLAGARTLTLAPEDLLIHLSIKFLLDRRYQSSYALGQLCDVSEVIKHHAGSLDWDLVERTARESGVEKGLHFVLYTCQSLLQTPVPASVMERFQPRDFSPASAEMFIRRRVLDIRPWLAHGLLDSKPALNRPTAILAIVSRASNYVRDVIKDNGNRDNLKRVRNILPRLGRALFKPKELKQDLKLDRWLHELYKANLKVL